MDKRPIVVGVFFNLLTTFLLVKNLLN